MVQSERNEKKKKKRKINAAAAPKVVMFQQRNLEKRCIKKKGWKRTSIM